LESTGLSNITILWIRDFLSGRKQYVTIDGKKSSEVSITSGVPQGSVLGPLLFLIYINNLPSNCRLFADDALIYNSSENFQMLTQDLKFLENWCLHWQMNFNTSKCYHIQFGKSQPPGRLSKFVLNGQALATVSSHSYLGVELQQNLRWNNHIDSITNRATQRIAMLRRVLKHADTKTKKLLTSPLLDQCWSMPPRCGTHT